jgi:hypothetical protein
MVFKTFCNPIVCIKDANGSKCLCSVVSLPLTVSSLTVLSQVLFNLCTVLSFVQVRALQTVTEYRPNTNSAVDYTFSYVLLYYHDDVTVFVFRCACILEKRLLKSLRLSVQPSLRI